jgi:TIR domain/SIR2-like domain
MVRVFISYRRSDTPSAGRQLADALKRRFGAESVFIDTRDLDLGSSWRSEITQRVGDADVVLAVIGPRWVTIADERGRRQVADPGEEDVLRIEIETALRGRPRVVPVLVDDAEMPARDRLPRPFKPLTQFQAATLRHSSWDRDVAALVASLQNVGPQPPAVPEASSRRPALEPQKLPSAVGSPAKRRHYETVARHMANGTVVPVIGPGANAGDRDDPWEEGCGWLPDGDELAAHLSRRFAVEPQLDDLARVSQQILLTEGDVDLYRALREILIKADCPPGPVHRFLATVPALLREHGRDCYPLIVTTNYDTALEQAFDAMHEPFDIVVFIARGEHKGRFLHVPWWDGDGPEPGPITVPNSYIKLPIDGDLDLARTVIVKIHGGPVYDAPREYQLRDNFVVTEDDYIGFLSRNPVESLIPVQILNKLRESHYLFLGYGMRHWSLRVFLRRIWTDQHIGAKSWAIQRTLDTIDTEFWEKFDVERISAPLSAYVGELEDQLAQPSETRAG